MSYLEEFRESIRAIPEETLRRLEQAPAAAPLPEGERPDAAEQSPAPLLSPRQASALADAASHPPEVPAPVPLPADAASHPPEVPAPTDRDPFRLPEVSAPAHEAAALPALDPLPWRERGDDGTRPDLETLASPALAAVADSPHEAGGLASPALGLPETEAWSEEREFDRGADPGGPDTALLERIAAAVEDIADQLREQPLGQPSSEPPPGHAEGRRAADWGDLFAAPAPRRSGASQSFAEADLDRPWQHHGEAD